MIFYVLDTTRRDWIYSILQATGALAAMPALYAGQQHTHGAPAPLAEEASPDWHPQFFNDEQNQTLIALGERIVPGSTDAFCNRIIDLIMTIESDQTRQGLLHAMAEFDHQAQAQYQKPFRAVTPQQQDAILTIAVSDKGQLHSQFSVVKEWFADTYWSSEKGLREMGWTGRMAWESFPGCGNPAAHN